MWERAAAALTRADAVAITSHIDPDPDAIGSCLALWHSLRQLNKKAQVLLADKVPRFLQFLPGTSQVVVLGRDSRGLLAEEREFDTLVILDCEPNRTGGILPESLNGLTVVNIDHHVSNRAQAAVRVVDSDAAATAELVAELLQVLGTRLDRDVATCLMAAIVGDTGSFAYSSTSPKTHELAAKLLRAGASSEEIHQQLLETVPWGYTQLLCEVLRRLYRSEDGRLAWIEIPLDLEQSLARQDQDSENIVRYARMIEGVEVATLIREIEPNRTKVSFRSRGDVDVSRVAEFLGGGGHRKASGCTLETGLEEARDRVLAVLREALKSKV